MDNIQKFLHSAEQNLTQHQLKDYQKLWMKHQLEDYLINESNIPILYDNTAVIGIYFFFLIAKLIEIKYHLLRDYVQKNILSSQLIDTDHQWADIFTKPVC